MAQQALGLIETKGLAAAIEAVDRMMKTADVEVIRAEKIGGGLITVLIGGDVASVKAAMESGAEGAKKYGELIAVRVIPKPHRIVRENFDLKMR